jgi:murein L,D-transpeptidase YafK
MEEIYGLVDEAFKGGQDRIQLAAFPFRLTTQNLSRHADNPNVPFWEMLKSGDDAFFATGQPPSVAVCDRRYVFNPAVTDTFDPSSPCLPDMNSSRVAGTPRSPAKLSRSVSYPSRVFTRLDRVIE